MSDEKLLKYSELEKKGLSNIKSSLNSLGSKYYGSDGLFKVFPKSEGSNWLTSVILKIMASACGLIDINKAQAKQSMLAVISSQQPDGRFNVVGKLIHNDIVGKTNSKETDNVALTGYAVIAMTEYAIKMDDKECQLEAIPDIDQKITSALGFLETQSHASTSTRAILNYAKLLYNENRLKKRGSVGELGKGPLGGIVGELGGQLAGGRNAGFRSSTDGVIQNIIDAAITDPSTGHTHWTTGEAGQNVARNIELTAYNMLSLVIKNKLKAAGGAAKWMASKLNANGGFATTKDTMLALEALTAYRQKSCNIPDLTVDVALGDKLLNFTFDEHNTEVVNERDIEISPNMGSTVPVKVSSNGTGCFLVQAILQYNVKKIPQKCLFSLTVSQENNRKMKICAKYIGTSENTNMVLIEVELQTGYSPMKESIEALMSIDNPSNDYSKVVLYEIKESEHKLVLYFEEMKKTESCYEIELTHLQAVKHLQHSIVSIYDYYNPLEKCTVRYKSQEEDKKGKLDKNIQMQKEKEDEGPINEKSMASSHGKDQDYDNYYDKDDFEF